MKLKWYVMIWKEIKVSRLHMSLYASVWLNWCVMCDDWVIDLHVIIMVEMKPVYWGLKGNQGTVIADGSLWG